MEIFVGADYKGLEKKQKILGFLAKKDYNVNDLGTYDSSENDYNDPAIAVSKMVRKNRDARGILICDSAHGMTIQANRFKGIRAANCDSEESVKLAREHDDINVLCLAAHFLELDKMQELIEVFLNTKFIDYERRIRRINRLDERGDYD
ncbi:MAG: RpiB/LacA/LacB family sugar-phosphate isomerase [Candidatus Saccharimonadaceae bacterium]|nr:RpiB/LacA/LacB family sugar-phosphate isomerase [Candidatus Saccharimonadaceae bacterium]